MSEENRAAACGRGRAQKASASPRDRQAHPPTTTRFARILNRRIRSSVSERLFHKMPRSAGTDGPLQDSLLDRLLAVRRPTSGCIHKSRARTPLSIRPAIRLCQIRGARSSEPAARRAARRAAGHGLASVVAVGRGGYARWQLSSLNSLLATSSVRHSLELLEADILWPRTRVGYSED